MHIKIINPKTDGNQVYKNTGGVDHLAAYLQHELKEKNHPEEAQGNETHANIFFDQLRENVGELEVIERINQNGIRIGREAEKFYTIVISPSKEELAHINNDNVELVLYTRKVMENYAINFKLKEGTELDSSKLIWFATVHEDRIVKQMDLKQGESLSSKEMLQIEELQNSGSSTREIEIQKIIQKANKRNENRLDGELFTVGDSKPGKNKHIHVIISRLDETQKITLNPRGRSKIFNIRNFQKASAQDFQKMFGYEKDSLQKGFYEKHTQHEKAYFNERIGGLVGDINTDLKDKKIDAEKMKSIGEKYSYSRAFFINLSKLRDRFQDGFFVHDPYFFVAHGREQKAQEYFSEIDKKMYGNDWSKSEEIPSVPGKGKEKCISFTERLLYNLKIQTGPGLIQETFLFDEERKRLNKHRQRSINDNSIEPEN